MVNGILCAAHILEEPADQRMNFRVSLIPDGRESFLSAFHISGPSNWYCGIFICFDFLDFFFTFIDV